MIQALGDYDARQSPSWRDYGTVPSGHAGGHRQPAKILPVDVDPHYPAGGFVVNPGFEGRVAIVGGSSSGLGFSVAASLAAEGARVVVVSRSAERVSAAVDRDPRARRRSGGGLCR